MDAGIGRRQRSWTASEAMAKATVVGLKRGAERPANVERRVPPPNLPNTCEHPILNLLREATARRNFDAVIPALDGQLTQCREDCLDQHRQTSDSLA
jgi:hypothetical protein